MSVDSGTVTYAHNGQGQRVVKDDGSETLFAYDEAGRLIGEYDDTGVPIQETVYFVGAPVAVLSGSNSYYVHTDHLGTPRIITDGNTIIWRWESDPFGTTPAQEDPDGDLTSFTYDYRFPGQYYDDETGLHYNYVRDYNPSIGRYTQSDPVDVRDHVLNFFADKQAAHRLGISALRSPAIPLELNTYSYVAGNPIRWSDPTGEAIAIPVFCLLTPANAAACAAAIVATATVVGKAIEQCLTLFDKDKDEECYQKCKHLLPSPSGDLQASEYRKCYRECKGSL